MQNNNAYLKIVTDYSRENIVPIRESLSIGRANCGSTADCMIESPLVSKNHGRFYCVMGRFFYEDNASSNGTYINDVHLGGRITQTKLLGNGDILRIGDEGDYPPVMIKFSLDDPSDDNFDAKKVVSDSCKTPDEPVLKVQEKPARVAAAGNSPVSSNAPKITPRPPVSGKGPTLSINIKERTVMSHFNKKTLLKDIKMNIKSGEFVLILGGSGAGKTTYMNAVMGYEKADGIINYGEFDLYEDYESVKYSIGFVPQQELLRMGDSVIDTLKNAAAIKMPANTSAEKKAERINEILEMMGLTREQNSLVQKLSGGQKKRLSIAVELISNPGLFFLDEPDSGLDGIMARSLMDDLRSIADKGKIVMIITHGPDRAADLFDKVIVLAKGSDNTGHLAFYGSVTEAFKFFDTNSLEGVVRRINRKDEGGDGLSDHYIEKYANQVKE